MQGRIVPIDPAFLPFSFSRYDPHQNPLFSMKKTSLSTEFLTNLRLSHTFSLSAYTLASAHKR